MNLARRCLIVVLALLPMGMSLAEDPPKPVVAWASGPLEVRVALDRPASPAMVAELAGDSITFAPATDTPRVEGMPRDPGRGGLQIAAARLEDDGRTLVLATDPHPWDARFSFDLGAQGVTAYTLSGVEAIWEPAEAGAEPSPLWWPHLDPAEVAKETAGSAAHARSLEALARPGRLTLRTMLRPSSREERFTLKAGGPIVIEEAMLDGEPGTLVDGSRGAVIEAPAHELPAELNVILRTGEAGEAPASLRLAMGPREGESSIEATAEAFVLPWAPEAPPRGNPAQAPAGLLEGGDAARGAAVFRSEEAKCATCHAVGGQGGKVGPALDDLPQWSRAAVYQAVAEPSAAIHPDYVTFTVVANDGRVLAGVVESSGPELLRIVDANAQGVELARGEVTEIRPSATSIMPVGLAGALGPEKLRDLIAYLTSKKD